MPEVRPEPWSTIGGSPASARRARFSGGCALTPSERRVAELAASGATNRDIAWELFVTTTTGEAHLSSAYRKLGASDARSRCAARGRGRALRSAPTADGIVPYRWDRRWRQGPVHRLANVDSQAAQRRDAGTS